MTTYSMDEVHYALGFSGRDLEKAASALSLPSDLAYEVRMSSQGTPFIWLISLGPEAADVVVAEYLCGARLSLAEEHLRSDLYNRLQVPCKGSGVLAAPGWASPARMLAALLPWCSSLALTPTQAGRLIRVIHGWPYHGQGQSRAAHRTALQENPLIPLLLIESPELLTYWHSLTGATNAKV